MAINQAEGDGHTVPFRLHDTKMSKLPIRSRIVRIRAEST